MSRMKMKRRNMKIEAELTLKKKEEEVAVVEESEPEVVKPDDEFFLDHTLQWVRDEVVEEELEELEELEVEPLEDSVVEEELEELEVEPLEDSEEDESDDVKKVATKKKATKTAKK